jgi:hypothetical protein
MSINTSKAFKETVVSHKQVDEVEQANISDIKREL